MDHPRLIDSAGGDANRSPDGIAIRFRTDQNEANTSHPGNHIVAVEIGRAVVRRKKEVDISVPIEVAVCQPAADLRIGEAAANGGRNIAEVSAPVIQEKLWRLRVSDIMSNRAHGVVDVSVDGDKIESSAEIHVSENTAEPERSLCG